MKKQALKFATLAPAFLLTSTLAITGAEFAAPDHMSSTATAATVAFDTEDVLYLKDGRVLRGNVVKEDEATIRFEYVDRKLGLSTPITVFKYDVVRLDRDVEIVGGSESETKVRETNAEENGKEVDMSLPGLYVIPITGQMGTDVRPEIYDEIIADVKAKDPECVIFKIDCDERDFRIRADRNTEYLDFEEYRTLVYKLQRGLQSYRQVVWIEESVGVSSVIAMSWPEIYMMPDARLDGLSFVGNMTGGWADEDVREKMKAAWSGVVKGFFELGKHDLDIGHAMMFPSANLSASFKGLDVIWELDNDGEVVVDNHDKVTAGFDAENARNLRISQETVEEFQEEGQELDDMAFILGYREYRKVDGEAEEIIEEYIDDWRSTMAQTEEFMGNVEKYMGWATGEDTIKFMGRARGELEKILSAMNKYRAVEKEWERRGVSKLALELRIKEIQETIRGLQQRERGGGTRGRGGGGRGGGNGPRIQ